MNRIVPYIAKDKYFFNKICNIYFDTENYDLTIRSLEKPTYKEKVRVRSYGTPSNEDIVFLEIKKKYEGVLPLMVQVVIMMVNGNLNVILCKAEAAENEL